MNSIAVEEAVGNRCHYCILWKHDEVPHVEDIAFTVKILKNIFRGAGFQFQI